jgi:hypothetical protein
MAWGLGLSDDEAYYWVLAQKPRFASAYHPGFTAWILWAFQHLGFPRDAAWVVRLLAILMTLGFSELFFRTFQVKTALDSCLFFSLAAVFALAWMFVPDHGLFLGFGLLFWGVHHLENPSKRMLSYLACFLGAFIAQSSKYSGVLLVGSAGMHLSWLALQGLQKVGVWRGLLSLLLGEVCALLPILIWNAQHEWGSILYQLQARHAGASLSFARLGVFWALQVLILGPLGVFLLGRFISHPRRSFMVWLWIAPAFVLYGLQPLFSAYKPHWILIAWLGLFAFGLKVQAPRWLKKVQVGVGFALFCIIALLLRVPVAYFIPSLATQTLKDVAWDFYGWSQLAKDPLVVNSSWPMIANRYQTAAQAQFAMQRQVGLVPCGVKDCSEWAAVTALDQTDHQWGRLKSPVWFVSDDRYKEPPQFVDADCAVVRTYIPERFGIQGKRIHLWLCRPLIKTLFSRKMSLETITSAL